MASKYLTENVFFNNPLIAYGPCPSCNVGNRIYFGDILGVEVSSEKDIINHQEEGGGGRLTGVAYTTSLYPLVCGMFHQGPKDIAEITCKNCGTEAIIQRSTLRVTTIQGEPEEDPVLAVSQLISLIHAPPSPSASSFPFPKEVHVHVDDSTIGYVPPLPYEQAARKGAPGAKKKAVQEDDE